ncbi:hypothetical protein [Kiloniella laminariae]|uniref:hypothetical protein n=1 Tax=Kiloniella laminariae TaxID=454162 RepID=UPI0012FC1B52|nr:hypothetical protein [Kiloniella laminariae]
MTISATPRRASYSGDGATVTFAVPFKFLTDSHLKVVVTAADGSELAVAPALVTGAGEASGGSVSLAVAPAAGETVTILGNTPLEQQTDLAISDGMPADVIETAVDLLTIQNQEQADQIGLAIKLPVSYSGDALQFPAPVANEVPYYDTSGKLVTSTVGFGNLMGTVQDLITLAGETGQAHSHPFSVLTGTEKVVVSDQSKTLDVGYPTSENDYGTLTAGQSLTIDLTKQRITRAINNGAFILAADPVNSGEQVIYLTNGAGAGAVTLSGLTLAPGSGAFDAASGNVYRCFVEQSAAGNFIWIEAMQ